MNSVDYKELTNFSSQPDNVPLVIRGAILMSEGIWNEMYYDKSEIQKALKQTDWNSREKRNLFLDHKDNEASEWIGDVQNMNFKGDTLYGDLYIYDTIWAAKLKYGNPKVGISPKVMGDADEKNKIMSNFTFENFSVVMNPAVKKAYINNMEKLKLDDNESVVEEGEDSKKSEEVEIPEEETEIEENLKEEKCMDDSTRDLADLFELFESKNLSVTKVLKKADEIREKEESLKDSLRRAGRILEEEAKVAAEADAVKEAEEAKAKKEEEAKPEVPVEEVKEEATKEETKEGEAKEGDAEVEVKKEEDVKEMKQKIKELSQKLETLSNEPETRELKKTRQELTSDDPDEGMIKYLQKVEEDSTNVA